MQSIYCNILQYYCQYIAILLSIFFYNMYCNLFSKLQLILIVVGPLQYIARYNSFLTDTASIALLHWGWLGKLIGVVHT